MEKLLAVGGAFRFWLVEFSVVVRSFLAMTVFTEISPIRPEDSPTPLSREFF